MNEFTTEPQFNDRLSNYCIMLACLFLAGKFTSIRIHNLGFIGLHRLPYTVYFTSKRFFNNRLHLVH